MSPFFELNTGAKIPSVGLGTWRADHGLIGDALATAIKVSLPHTRHFFFSFLFYLYVLHLYLCVDPLQYIVYIFVDGTYLIRVHCSRNLVFCVYYILSACLLFTLYTTFLYVSKKIIFFLGVKVKLIFFLCLMVQILYNFPKDVKIMALMTFWINICTGFSRMGCFSALAYCLEGTRKIIAWMKINSQPGN